MVKGRFDIWNPVPPTYIRYVGIWDMQALYQGMIEWFRQRKFRFYEKIYKHKHPSPFGLERQYVWQGTKEETEWIASVFDVYIHTYDAHDIIVKEKEKKRIFTKGRIWIEFKVQLQYDWEKRRMKNKFYKELHKFFYLYFWRERQLQGWSPRTRQEMYKLHFKTLEMLRMESAEFEQKYLAGYHRLIPK